MKTASGNDIQKNGQMRKALRHEQWKVHPLNDRSAAEKDDPKEDVELRAGLSSTAGLCAQSSRR